MTVTTNFNAILPQGKTTTNEHIMCKFSDGPSSTSRKIAKDVLKSMESYAKKLSSEGKLEVLYDTDQKGVELIQNAGKIADPSKIRHYRKERRNLLIAGLVTLLASIAITTALIMLGMQPFALIGVLGIVAGTGILLGALGNHLKYKKEIDKMAKNAVDLYHCVAQQCTNKQGTQLTSTLAGKVTRDELKTEVEKFIQSVSTNRIVKLLPAYPSATPAA